MPDTFDFPSPAAPVLEQLLRAGVAPTAQRLAVGQLLLPRPVHMRAEQVHALLREQGVGISRATVYSTLRLFVQHGLLRELDIEGHDTVFDSNMQPHHHFYDTDTHTLCDIAADALSVQGLPGLPADWCIDSVQVLVRGRRQRADAGHAKATA